MKGKLLELFKARDTDFIDQFCALGVYMDDTGKPIGGVCRPVSAEEMLNFMHQYDAMVTEVLITTT